MSIQPVQSPMLFGPLSMVSPMSKKSPTQTSAPAQRADDASPRGVAVMHRELAERRAAAAKFQSPEKMLTKLAGAPIPTPTPTKHDQPQRAAAAQIQKTAHGVTASSNVALNDVKAALAKINVEAVTDAGQPMTQQWIDEQLAMFRDKGIEPPQQSSSQTYEITIEGLVANWGKTDSIYDLTGNGVVDGEDLLALLAEGGTMTVEVPADYQHELTLEGLLAAWGKSNSLYDLTGDGTVGGADLLLFLQWYGQNDE